MRIISTVYIIVWIIVIYYCYCRYKNCNNTANISKWTLSMDGEDVKAEEFLITVGASGIEAKYLPPGFQIIIR